MTMLHTWQAADISDNAVYDGDLRRALAGIRARAVIMPASSDLYFPPEDSALEVALLPQGELRVIETDWGHSAGGPDRNRSGTAFIESTLSELLNR